MTPAMAPATETGLEAEATLSTSQGGLPSPVIVRKPSSICVLSRCAGSWDAELGKRAASLSRSAVRRPGIFRSGLLPARLSVKRQAALGTAVDHHRIPA